MRLNDFLEHIINQQPLPEPGNAPIEQEADGADTGDDDQPVQLNMEVRQALDFAEDRMDHHALEGPARDNVRSFAKLNDLQRDIELYVLIETLKHRTGVSTAAHEFLRSQVFGTHVVDRLKLLILAPHGMFYVSALQEWALNHMHEHPEAWKIPLEVVDNKDQWEIFAMGVRVKLTTLRSQIKQLIFKGYKDGQCINKITTTIFPKQTAISEAHCARWAWIVLSIDDFDEACNTREYEKTGFWDFIEDQLAEAKKAIFTNPLFATQAIRTGKFAEVFCHALSQHRLMFPTTRVISRLRPTQRPAWQESIEEAIGMGREVYA